MLSKQITRFITVLCISGLLSACGFHLRESVAFPEKLQAAAIHGVTEFSELDLAFRKAFHKAGYALVTRDTAQTILKVNTNKFSRRVLSVNSTGDPNEYELTYLLEVAVLDNDNKQVMPEQTIKLFRGYRYNPNIRLAKDAEEARLKTNMINDAVRQVLHRIGTVLKN